MYTRKRFVAIASCCSAALLLISCGGLPREVRNQISSEREKLQQADRQLKHSQDTLREDLAHSPELFKGASVSTEWPAKLQSASATLARAKSDLQQLDKFSGNDRNREERSLRESAVRDAESVETGANKWLDFERNTPHYLTQMQRDYDQIHNFDVTPVSSAVQKAEQDWPSKKADLDGRLAALRQSSDAAEAQWKATETARQDAASGKASGSEIATLIQADDVLERNSADLTGKANELRALSGQLYDSWDKVLADLEVAHRGGDTVYSEKVKTVRTHFTDVAAKKTDVSTDSKWVDVPASTYRSLENDLGMTIAHKDAGVYDSEAQNSVQPPGFAYIASPEQGSNQYGYWSHAGGQSVWTWLPQYLIMRELLWGHSYRPIVINEYNGYREAQRSGRVYYGQETPTSPPKYGSHGTFTGQIYANSRYVQSGGFKGSAYSSGRNATAPSGSFSGTPRTEPRFGSAPSDNGAGKRFGSGSSNGGGQRFGSGGSSGQKFGSPRPSPRMPGKSFGRRR
jgi:hypothetical protein